MGTGHYNKDIGALGEDIACKFLQKNGQKILERNFRRKWGEIDIITEKNAVVRFVEVKTVSRGTFSREINYRPEELAHKTKLRKVARTAALYMESKKDNREYQVDVVTVVLDRSTRTAWCRLFEQALEDNL